MPSCPTKLMLWSPRAGPNSRFLLEAVFRQVECGRCELTDNANHADIILVSEIDPRRPLANTAMRRLYRHHAKRMFFYSTDDKAIPWLPGIYASIEKRLYVVSRMRSGFYPIRVPAVIEMPDITGSELYLACFVGAIATHPVRRGLLSLRHKNMLITDTSNHPSRDNGEEDAINIYQRDYSEALKQSLFGLCPRGNGTSSVRLFECMAAGRSPVIISDDWVPPDGPDWDAFSVRVAERDVSSIDEKLRTLQPRAQEMGALARAAYQRWFSAEHAIETIINACREIQSARRVNEGWHRLLALSYFRSPFYLRYHLKPFLMDRLSSMIWRFRNV